MTASTVNIANIVTRFEKQFAKEFVRKGVFGPYIGTSANSIIQIKKGLKKVSLPLISALPSGEGQVGSSTLAGNEQALANYAFELTPTYYREGVLVDNEENEKSEFQLKIEAAPALKTWAMQLKRDHIINAFGAIEAGGTYLNYKNASGAQFDTWNVNNNDIILYGNAFANNIIGDHTASLATIDSVGDQCTAKTLRLAKQLAEEANPIIRPFSINGDEDTYVFFVGSTGFRSLSQDPEIVAANKDARARGVNNPLFTGGDLLFDGIVIKKVADEKKFIDGDGTGSAFDAAWGANATADSLATGGASSSRVEAGWLCGSQAIGFALGKMPTITRRKDDDYDFLNGVGVQLKHDIKKIFYNNKQFGCVSVFYSGV